MYEGTHHDNKLTSLDAHDWQQNAYIYDNSEDGYIMTCRSIQLYRYLTHVIQVYIYMCPRYTCQQRLYVFVSRSRSQIYYNINGYITESCIRKVKRQHKWVMHLPVDVHHECNICNETDIVNRDTCHTFVNTDTGLYTSMQCNVFVNIQCR